MIMSTLVLEKYSLKLTNITLWCLENIVKNLGSMALLVLEKMLKKLKVYDIHSASP